jgi:ribose transport system substrate-binding protein
MQRRGSRAALSSWCKLALAAMATLAVLVVLAGCGGSSSSSSSGSSGSSGEEGAVAKKAEQEIAQYLKPPTSNGITKPMKQKPPSGKVIYTIACGLAPCKVLQDGATEAGEALGWTVKNLVTDGTPENITEQVEEALNHHADGIMVTGFSRSSFEPAVQKASQQGVPMVNSGTPDTVKPPFIAVSSNGAVLGRNSRIMAKWIVAESGAAADVAVFHVSTFPALDYAGQQLTAQIGESCPSCTVTETNSQITEVGTDLPQKVVSGIQQDPNINYLYFTDGSFATGVPAALRDAGLSEQVKLTSAQPTEVDFENLRDGSAAAYMAYPLAWMGWAGIDSFGRLFNGEDPKTPPLAAPTQILTKETVGNIKDWEPPNYQEDFKKLWHVG